MKEFPQLKEVKVLGDERGQLVVFEGEKEIPFQIKRVFHIYGTQEGIQRGQHSHYKTKQFLVAIKGECKVILDNGIEKKTYTLNKPNVGLFQNALIWGTMYDFSQDCILIVFANTNYDESDYIRDYNQFLKEVNR